MRKARNVFIGIPGIIAFFVALAGCANTNNCYEQVADYGKNGNQATQQVEEPEEKIGYTGDLILPRNIVVPGLTTKMQHEKGTTAYMTASGNAVEVGLDADIFDVASGTGETTNYPGLNTDGTIRLYSKNNAAATGHGSFFVVSVPSGYSIQSIVVSFKQYGEYAAIYSGDSGDPIGGVDNAYLINNSSFKVENVYQSNGSYNYQVHINYIDITYSAPGANEVVEDTLITKSSLSYGYSITGEGTVDKMTKTNTYALSEESGTGYKNWESGPFTSGVTYKGFSTGVNSSDYVQLKSDGSTSGIVTLSNANDFDAKKIIVKWSSSNSNGRKIDIYGKNTPYSAASDLYGSGDKGTKIGSMTYDSTAAYKETCLAISTSYKYIGIRSYSGAAYLDFISVHWDVSFSYSDVAIRFGNLMKKSLWDRLNSESTIEKYGVMLSTAEYLGSDSIQDKYDEALTTSSGDIDAAITSICSGNNIKNYFKSIPTDKVNPDLATLEQKGELIGDYYIWNLYKNVSSEELKTGYTAVAYIRTTANGMIFLSETTTSAKKLAHALLDSGAYTDDLFDGTLANLAYLA